MICEYFGEDTSSDSDTFHYQLLHLEEAKLPTMYFAPKFLAEVMPGFKQDFQNYVQSILRGINECSSTAEQNLQFVMMFPLRAICSLAKLSTESQFEYSLEPVVCSVPCIGQPGVVNQLSDLKI